MTGVNLNDAKLNEYINARWLKYVEWWDWRSRQAKRKYQALRSAVVVGSALKVRGRDCWVICIGAGCGARTCC